MAKKLKELNLLDNFLFETLATHPQTGVPFGRKLVEIILHRSPEKVRVVAQRAYPGSDTSFHGVRLDVYLEEEQAASEADIPWSYDIEPERDNRRQAVNSLPKRVCFYHAKIDAKGLKAGDSYHKLKNVAVILITPFDPFGWGRMVYTIRSKCVEEPDMPYDDGSFTLFLYTGGQKDVPSEELRQFLNYCEHTTEENACSRSLQEIHEMVTKVKLDEEVELQYMKIFEREEMIREEGYDAGLSEGRSQGLSEGLSEGRQQQLLRQVFRKLAKGKSSGEIAGELEEDVENISRLCALINANPGKSPEELAHLVTVQL